MDFVKNLSGMMEDKTMDLEARAKELGIDVQEGVTQDELKKLIADKENEQDDSKDVEYWRAEAKKFSSELKKAIAKRDALKSDKQTLAGKIKELEDSMVGMTDKKQLDDLRTELEELKEFKNTIDKKKEKEKLDKLDEVERIKLEKDKKVNEIQQMMDDLKASFNTEKEQTKTELEKARDRIAKLRKSTLDVDIMEAAGKNKAWSPKQIVKLVRDDFTYDDGLDKYSYIKRDAKGKVLDELTVDEYVSEFLKLEENENLVRSDANTASFNSDKATSTTTSSTTTSKYNPKDPDIIEKASDNSMSPERYIKTLEARDKAMARRKKTNN